jgi:hypothetical protein
MNGTWKSMAGAIAMCLIRAVACRCRTGARSALAPLAITAGSCTTIAMLLEEDGIGFLDRSGMSYLAIDHQGHIFRRT